MNETKSVVKFCTALGDPFFVDVSRLENPSVDIILQEAIKSLATRGNPLEAQQLEQLAEKHQFYNGNREVGKGMLFDALAQTKSVVGDLTVNVAEVTLMTNHAGGSE